MKKAEDINIAHVAKLRQGLVQVREQRLASERTQQPNVIVSVQRLRPDSNRHARPSERGKKTSGRHARSERPERRRSRRDAKRLQSGH